MSAAQQIGQAAGTRVQHAVSKQGAASSSDTSSISIRQAGATAPANRPGAPEVEWSPDMDRKLRDEYPTAKPYYLADDLGVALATLYKRLRVLGIPLRGHPNAVSADKSQQMRADRATGMSIHAVAKKHGVIRRTVIRHTAGAQQ